MVVRVGLAPTLFLMWQIYSLLRSLLSHLTLKNTRPVFLPICSQLSKRRNCCMGLWNQRTRLLSISVVCLQNMCLSDCCKSLWKRVTQPTSMAKTVHRHLCSRFQQLRLTSRGHYFNLKASVGWLWSARWGSNPRHSTWKDDTLPAELLAQYKTRLF